MLLQDKTILVTGVGAGLGREMAESALRQGANVVIAARSADALEAAAQELDSSGKRVTHLATDIANPDACTALAAHAEERFGRIDALVQVAAYEQAFGGLYDTDFESWRKAFDTNVVGSMTLVRAVASAMKQVGSGSIVFIGSQSMFMPAMPQAGYAASKGALLSAMYYLADELGPDGIRVNMIVPSWMWGPPVEALVKFRAQKEDKTEDAVLEEIVGRFPLRRMAEDGEVADATMFFCSDLSRAITGQNLMVNCGEMLR